MARKPKSRTKKSKVRRPARKAAKRRVKKTRSAAKHRAPARKAAKKSAPQGFFAKLFS